jgi:hypothetical protein
MLSAWLTSEDWVVGVGTLNAETIHVATIMHVATATNVTVVDNRGLNSVGHLSFGHSVQWVVVPIFSFPCLQQSVAGERTPVCKTLFQFGIRNIARWVLFS